MQLAWTRDHELGNRWHGKRNTICKGTRLGFFTEDTNSFLKASPIHIYQMRFKFICIWRQVSFWNINGQANRPIATTWPLGLHGHTTMSLGFILTMSITDSGKTEAFLKFVLNEQVADLLSELTVKGQKNTTGCRAGRLCRSPTERIPCGVLSASYRSKKDVITGQSVIS